MADKQKAPPQEKRLDKAIADTFPASDPVAISQPAPSAPQPSSPAKADMQHIAADDEQELRFWAAQFGVDVDRVRQAIAAVGIEVAKVRAYLGK
jgi:hypothetical protein